MLLYTAGQVLIGLGLLHPGPVWMLALVPVPLLLTALAWRTGGMPDQPSRERRGWRLVSAAFAFYGAANLLGSGARLGLTGPQWIQVEYMGVTAHHVLLTWGVLLLAPRPGGLLERLKFLLDTMAVLVGGVMIVTNLYVDRGSLVTPGTSADVLTVALLLGGVGLFMALVAIILRTWPNRLAPAAIPLGVGILLAFVGDLAAGQLQAGGRYLPGAWPDLLWVASAVFVALSAQVAWLTRQGHLRPWQPARFWQVQFLPYVTLIVATGVVLFTADLSDAARGLIWGMSGITVMVVSRQATVLYENSRLLTHGTALTEELRRSENRFRSLIQHSSDVIAVLGADWRIRYSSPAAGPLTGTDPAHLIGVRLADLVHPEDLDSTRQAMTQAQRSVVRCRIRNAGSGWRHVEASVNNLLDDPGVEGIVVNVRDVTERHLLEERLTHQAYHDALTGLANRVLFHDYLSRTLEVQRQAGRPVAILFLDLDGFKTVNDSLGHQAGDQLLLEVARKLRRSVGSMSESIARLGGDEFAVLLSDAGPAEAQEMAGQVLAALAAPSVLDGREVFIEASIGVAVSPQSAESADDLMRDADAAMYSAKARGKGRYALYHASMHARAVHRLELEADLRGALENRELVVHYQPLVELAEGAITGFEALVRWNHPRRGLVPPAEFIPLAEETGLIVPLGLFVLEEACRQAAVWWGRPGHAGLRMSVNISARQLVEPAFARDVARILRAHNVPRGSLILEITETVLVEGTDTVLGALADLKGLGVLIAIDDFGTGYSSLGYLRRFSADILKIDRSFIDRLGRDDKESALVQAISELSRTFGLVTVAEGVERGEQVAELRRLRCQGAQGFFFSRPLDAESASALLSESRVRVR
ncbi:MAG TPA: EAL domain-containing protein [Symbiobacteriaceae bacterium]|nr:EAL domain-containing protein [Symbiobacteriaceae bacterium]